MDRFLTNYNYDTYNGQELNFKKYICKDCTQKKKEYEYDNSNRQPKDVSNIGYIEVLSGLYPVKIQTPTMVCPFGFNRQTNQIYLQFSNAPSFIDVTELGIRNVPFNVHPLKDPAPII